MVGILVRCGLYWGGYRCRHYALRALAVGRDEADYSRHDYLAVWRKYMTRINVVPVEELVRQHLVAEYRELPRVFGLATAALASGRLNKNHLPQTYRLGAGHVLFFYDKLGFLYERQLQLFDEMKRRGYHPALDPKELRRYRVKSDASIWNGYTPTPEALAINRARISERLSAMKIR